MSVYIDLTQLICDPIRTGIQRISGEICRYAPPNSLIPVRFRSDHFVALPKDLIKLIGGHFRDPTPSGFEEITRLGAFENGKPVTLLTNDTLLVAEIFHGDRAEFFRQMSDQQLSRCRFVVYDLLPLTHPEYFPVSMPLALSPYYQNVRRASDCGFISKYTRDTCYSRLKRTTERGGVVLPLGCDSLGQRPRNLRLNRPLTFSVIGTIEPRKNHALILDAFEPLLRQIGGLKLSFIGRMGWVNAEFAKKVSALTSDKNSGFNFFSAPDDGTIRTHVEQSRATIYVSSAEGYGLPPVESLWLGTPAIASATNPSLQELGSSAGMHVVDPLTVVNLRRAVLAFLDDEYANRKTQETLTLNLPTWQSFTQEVLRWCSS